MHGRYVVHSAPVPAYEVTVATGTSGTASTGRLAIRLQPWAIIVRFAVAAALNPAPYSCNKSSRQVRTVERLAALATRAPQNLAYRKLNHGLLSALPLLYLIIASNCTIV
jgi:hypothetical protein